MTFLKTTRDRINRKGVKTIQSILWESGAYGSACLAIMKGIFCICAAIWKISQYMI